MEWVSGGLWLDATMPEALQLCIIVLKCIQDVQHLPGWLQAELVSSLPPTIKHGERLCLVHERADGTSASPLTPAHAGAGPNLLVRSKARSMASCSSASATQQGTVTRSIAGLRTH